MIFTNSSRNKILSTLRFHRKQNFATKADEKVLDYCINLVKRRSFEHYLANLLLPPKTRPVGFVIRAFNAEIAGIRDQVTAKHAGMGRMIFWRETLQNIYESRAKNPPNHPVAKALATIIHQV